jgi:SAM-dependent methyltransferase
MPEHAAPLTHTNQSTSSGNRESVRTWEFYGNERSAFGRWYEWLRRRLNERLVHFLVNSMNESNPAPMIGDFPVRFLRVLEAGSGTAYASSCFANRSRTSLAVCMDIDHDALRKARQRDPGLIVVIGDLRHLPFAEGAFDLVFNNSTLEHLEQPEIAIAEMRRACRENGRVFIGVPFLFGPLWFQPLIARTALGIWLGRVFSRSALEQAIRSAGLRPTGCIRFFFRVFIGVISIPEPRTIPRAS